MKSNRNLIGLGAWPRHGKIDSDETEIGHKPETCSVFTTVYTGCTDYRLLIRIHTRSRPVRGTAVCHPN